MRIPSPDHRLRVAAAARGVRRQLRSPRCASTPPEAGRRRRRPPPPPADGRKRRAERAQLHTELAPATTSAARWTSRSRSSTTAVKLDPKNAQDLQRLRPRLRDARRGRARPSRISSARSQLAPNDSEIRHNWGWYLCTHGRAARVDSPSSSWRCAIRCTRRPRSRSSTPARARRRSATTRARRRVLPARAGGRPPNNRGRSYGLALLAYSEARLRRSARADAARDAADQSRRRRRSTSACASSASWATARPKRRTSSQLRNRYPDCAGSARRSRRGLRVMDREAQPAGGRGARAGCAAGAGAQLRAAREAAGLSHRRGRAAAEARAAPGHGARGRRLRAAARAARSCAASCATTRASCTSMPTLLVARCPTRRTRRRSNRRRCTRPRRRWASCPTDARPAPSFGALGDSAGAGRASSPRPATSGTAADPRRPAAPPRATRTRRRRAPDTATTPLPNPVAPDSGAPARRRRTGDRPAAARRRGAAQRRRAPRRQQRAPVAADAAADAPLVLAFRRPVVDRGPGPRRTDADLAPGRRRFASQPFDGAPPLSIVHRQRARRSTLLCRGQPVDLAPYTRLNVARLVLR